MSIIINIPKIKEVISQGINISISKVGNSWSQKQLGSFKNEIGVYVIHHKGIIKYVGKTNGEKMSFSVRLRRHFQEKAAGNKHTYPKLVKLSTPPSIKVSFFTLEEIEKKYVSSSQKYSNNKELIPLFESALILAYKPEFQIKPFALASSVSLN